MATTKKNPIIWNESEKDTIGLAVAKEKLKKPKASPYMLYKACMHVLPKHRQRNPKAMWARSSHDCYAPHVEKHLKHLKRLTEVKQEKAPAKAASPKQKTDDTAVLELIAKSFDLKPSDLQCAAELSQSILRADTEVIVLLRMLIGEKVNGNVAALDRNLLRAVSMMIAA